MKELEKNMIEDLERIFNKYRYSCEDLTIEKIIMESKYITCTYDFLIAWELYKKKDAECQFQSMLGLI